MVSMGRFFLHRPPGFSFVMQWSTDSHFSSQNTLAGSANPWLDPFSTRDDLRLKSPVNTGSMLSLWFTKKSFSSRLRRMLPRRLIARQSAYSTRFMAFNSGHRTNESVSTIRTMHTLIGLLFVFTHTRSERVRTSNNMRPRNHYTWSQSRSQQHFPHASHFDGKPSPSHTPCSLLHSLRGPRHAGSDLAHLPKSFTGSTATNTEKDDAGHSTAD